MGQFPRQSKLEEGENSGTRSKETDQEAIQHRLEFLVECDAWQVKWMKRHILSWDISVLKVQL